MSKYFRDCEKKSFWLSASILFFTRDCFPVLFLILIEFKRINLLLFPLKSSESTWFSDDFRGNRSYLIRINLVNIRSRIWRGSPSRDGKFVFKTEKWYLSLIWCRRAISKFSYDDWKFVIFQNSNDQNKTLWSSYEAYLR